MDALPIELFANTGVVGTCFFILWKKVGSIQEHINTKIDNGITSKLSKVAEDLAFMRGHCNACSSITIKGE